MKRLIQTVLGGLWLLCAVTPVFCAVEPVFMVNDVAGNVAASAADSTWIPLLGETLSEGTRLELKSASDTLDLVHLKLQKEIRIQGPKVLTIDKQGLQGVSEKDYGQSVGGIPSDLAMNADGLNQVGAVRDHAQVGAGGGKSKGIQASRVLKPQSVDGMKGAGEESAQQALALEEKLLEQEREKKRQELEGDKNESSPSESTHQEMTTGEPSAASSDNFTSMQNTESVPKKLVREQRDAGASAMAAPAASAPVMNTISLEVAVPEKALESALYSPDTGVTVNVNDQDYKASRTDASIKGWVVLRVPGVREEEQLIMSLVDKDLRNLQFIKLHLTKTTGVLEALTLESKGCHEQAAAVWFKLLQQGKVIHKVAEAHLKRLASKIEKAQYGSERRV